MFRSFTYEGLVTLPDELPRSAKVIAQSEENLDWVVVRREYISGSLKVNYSDRSCSSSL